MVTNIYQPMQRDFTVNKVWIGGPEEKPEIEIQLYRNGQAYGDAVQLANGETSHTWEGLEVLDDNKEAYIYTVDELNVPENYKKIVSGPTIINKYKESQPVDPEGPNDPEVPSLPQKPITQVDRIPGVDRIQTAIDLSQRYFDKSEIVIIVKHDTYPDSLTASVLAKAVDAPILLTASDKLDPRVAEEIERLGASFAYIVGGENSISPFTASQVLELTGETERLGGSDRFETSALVAEEVVSITGEKGIAVVASGETFPDALSISPYAAKEGYPILLVRKDSVPEVIEKAIEDLSISQTYVIGGENTIALQTENNLPGVIERIAGDNRYATSVEVAERFFKDADETAFIASGEIFADALVVGPVAAGEDAPILLVSRDNVPEEVDSYFKANSFEKLIIVGGTNTISTGVENTLEEY